MGLKHIACTRTRTTSESLVWGMDWTGTFLVSSPQALQGALFTFMRASIAILTGPGGSQF